MIDRYPDLAGVATSDLVEQIGSSNFKASYINWSRTMQLLRQHAPGWLPEMMLATDGTPVHQAPKGCYLMLYFRHITGAVTPAVPQAIMDPRNAAIPHANITARDITDTHRRGVCMAAALTFGLAYELWAKMPLESGYSAEEGQPEAETPVTKVKPTDGAWEAMDEEEQAFLLGLAAKVQDYFDAGDVAGAHDHIEAQKLVSEEKIALWSRLDSKVRSALKKEKENRK